MTTTNPRFARVSWYAAKFLADRDDTGQRLEPTDENLTAVFANCVRPAPTSIYDAIRDQLRASGSL